MFERPAGTGERAILVHMDLKSMRVIQEDLAELKELAKSAGAEPVFVLTASRPKPDAKYFIGSGKVEELRMLILEHEADIVLFNHSLTPSQERNLEKALSVRVVDRNGLILDIFAQRAQSFEGKLQVELAQLKHLSTRLVRGWTHLERQKGGIGLRGPGETQLETDRRLLAVRIQQIQRKLEKVESQRHQGRSKRKKAEIASVSLVGYTNAGKSTLFNTLTGADIYVADQLFATLDPTLRQCSLPDGPELVLADTVGFIRHLPHELVAAFKSTLQEASEADLLLHVIDANAEDRDDTIFQVNQILQDIGADKVPQLQVFNKIDLLTDMQPRLDRNEHGIPMRVWISAQSGTGIELLQSALAELFIDSKVKLAFFLSAEQAAIRAKLFDVAYILEEHFNETGGWDMRVEMDKKYLGVLQTVEVHEI
ncbi:MAG: ribosome rescue GTPase HflX [Methylococcales bacterium]